MKIIRYLFSMTLVVTFSWIMVKVANPTIISLDSPYEICKVNHVISWQSRRVSPKNVTSNFSSDPLQNYIELTFEHLDQSPSTPEIVCLNNIPVGTLYRAKTLKVTVSSNQPVEVGLTLHRMGGGPIWKPTSINSDQLNTPLLLSQPLSIPMNHKVNWLSGDYDAVVFDLEKYDPTKKLIFRIYDVYLE